MKEKVECGDFLCVVFERGLEEKEEWFLMVLNMLGGVELGIGMKVDRHSGSVGCVVKVN
ncbi:hypothetical protein [Bacillus velezensis]|uniref:hypothetical protein n=1 Tax=Bacillus velezensis TaxID=492670 RepID=UPI001643B15D|nr:hypothetical protein [Bacillus velezensis]